MTPLMKQYNEIKEKYSDEVLFFRLGDFYEMFNDDAVEISRLLNLTLTHRGGNPMCGIPFHASKIYIARLLRLGKKIAICEQIELPKGGKGIAKREVVEIITPGTAIEEEYLEQGAHNYLACASYVQKQKRISFSYIDVSTGAFFATSWAESCCCEELLKELGRLSPRELVLSASLYDRSDVQSVLNQFSSISLSRDEQWHFALDVSLKRLKEQFGVLNMHSFSLTDNSCEIASAGYLLNYIAHTSTFSASSKRLSHIASLNVYSDSDFVVIDDSSRRNLELTENLRDGCLRYSLLECFSHTKTAMGNRMLRSFFMHPLKDAKKIKNRQEHSKLFFNNQSILCTIREELSHILDVERLSSRIAMDRAHAKDLQALKVSLKSWIVMRNQTISFKDASLESVFYTNDTEKALALIDLIDNAILEDPSTSLTEGRLIKSGWSLDLDHIRGIQKNFNDYLSSYLKEEKEQTGIQNLKVKYTRNMGYVLEVSKGKLDAVPDHFILRRTLVNGERYTSKRLQELEAELLSAHERVLELEKELFLDVRKTVSKDIRYLLSIAQEIAYVDTISTYAYCAQIYNWVAPQIEDSCVLAIEGGRHPVVEMHLPSGEFVPNDTSFSDQNFALITGPNMAGKSTYLRQNALIVFLAQIGSFVPAKKATIGIVDRIFCRVGASDNLARGESTFLVEMSETALILRSATKKSLVIMDEVGRGTSTEDGLSIAWAVSEYLLNSLSCRTFFATHYHELTRITHPSMQLLQMAVKEIEDKVVFLKKIKKGASGSSYGLHVARLAGIPEGVVKRAYEILQSVQKNAPYTTLESDVELVTTHPLSSPPGLFSEEELILEEIISTDINNLTPLESLQKIARWHKELTTQ